MTDKIQQARRAAFELHMNANHPSISLRCYGEAQGCNGCNDYEDDMASAMYAAFNAALDCVVIELPVLGICAMTNENLGYQRGIRDSRAAIESTNLGIKVK